MGSSNIQAKIKKGLAKANLKVGSSSSDPVMVIKISKSGGNSPIDPPTITKTPTLLKNAIFKSYDKSVIGIDIKSGDRELVSDNDIPVLVGEIITQGSSSYVVISVDIKAPTSDVLVYMSQCRLV